MYRIVSRLHLIYNAEQRDYWLIALFKWHESYKSFINQKSIDPLTGRHWYTHKLIRISFTVIKKALPNLFEYLNNPRIPKTTNGIETFFAHLKGHLNINRGLSQKHKREYIQWYLYLKNKERFSKPKPRRIKKSLDFSRGHSTW